MSAMLQAQNLTVGYAGKPILRGVHFCCNAGQILCILGPNGGGKTTLFRSLMGFLPILEGEIFLHEKSLSSYSAKTRAQHIAYVPQCHQSLFSYRVKDVVLMGRAAHLSPLSSPGQHDITLAQESLQRLGILSLSERRLHTLSGGERQLVLIARALAQSPHILVMDEPTASLDFGNALRVLAHLAHLREQGLAIVMSTHHPEHARDYADQVIMLGNGQQYAQGLAKELLTSAYLAPLYHVEANQLPAHFHANP